MITVQEQELLNSLKLNKHPEEIENPFSKQKIVLEPQGVALYDFVKGSEYMINYPEIYDTSEDDVNMFQIALLLFRKLYPEAYAILLD